MLTCQQCGRDFTPTHPKQVDCSELCLCLRFDTKARKTRALARIFANTMGYRSMGEVRYASKLKSLGISFEYEKSKLEYQYNPQKYVVDFTIPVPKGNDIYIEYKGKLDGPTRKKMRAIRKSNPDSDIRFVFEKPNNFLYRGAKMRYWEWAEKYGFKWYDVRDLKQLKKDIKEAKRGKKLTNITNETG